MKIPGRLQAYHQDKANYQYTVFTTSRKIYLENLTEKTMNNPDEEEVNNIIKEEMSQNQNG